MVVILGWLSLSRIINSHCLGFQLGPRTLVIVRRVPRPIVTADELRARIAQRIREHAKRRGVPLSRLADDAGISRATIWAVLAGRVAATSDTLAKIAAVLGIDPDSLVRRPRAETGRSTPKR